MKQRTIWNLYRIILVLSDITGIAVYVSSINTLEDSIGSYIMAIIAFLAHAAFCWTLVLLYQGFILDLSSENESLFIVVLLIFILVCIGVISTGTESWVSSLNEKSSDIVSKFLFMNATWLVSAITILITQTRFYHRWYKRGSEDY